MRLNIGVAMIVGAWGLSAGLAFPERAAPDKRTGAMSDEKTLAMAMKRFRKDCGRYPKNGEMAKALFKAPHGLEAKWQGPYLTGHTMPNDPWGHPYKFNTWSKGLSITSYGRDGRPGGKGEDADVIDKES